MPLPTANATTTSTNTTSYNYDYYLSLLLLVLVILTTRSVIILAHGLHAMRSLLKGGKYVQQWCCVMACRPNLRHGSRKGSQTEARADFFLSTQDGLTGSWSESSRLAHDSPQAAGCRAFNVVRLAQQQLALCGQAG